MVAGLESGVTSRRVEIVEARLGTGWKMKMVGRERGEFLKILLSCGFA